MTPQAKDQKESALGLYVHVPFCASTCDFCAFYQKTPSRGDLDAYLSAIECEIESYSADDLGRVSTVFWGGGTPGILPPKALERLGAMIAQRVGPVQEWSVEMAPVTVHRDRLMALKAAGVTRISMGVQSFDDALLASLGRLHPRRQIFQAWDILQEAEMKNVNLDLIFAIPGQDEAALVRDLTEAIALGPQHLSTYCLTFEEDTALYVRLSEGKVTLDPEREERHYRLAWEKLEAAGYRQYEVSNFAHPDFACLHNLNTWRMQEWIGLGPSAASQFGGMRYTNPPSLKDWSAAALEGRLPAVRHDCVALTPSLLTVDALVFGLRMNAGLELDKPLGNWTATPLRELPVMPFLERCVDEGLAGLEGGRVRLTVEGRLVADALGARIMETFSEIAV